MNSYIVRCVHIRPEQRKAIVQLASSLHEKTTNNSKAFGKKIIHLQIKWTMSIMHYNCFVELTLHNCEQTHRQSVITVPKTFAIPFPYTLLQMWVCLFQSYWMTRTPKRICKIWILIEINRNWNHTHTDTRICCCFCFLFLPFFCFCLTI